MLEQVLDVFKVVPDYDLGDYEANQTLFTITTIILDKIQAVLEQKSLTLFWFMGIQEVQHCHSFSCLYMGIKVGHMEAQSANL